MRFFSEGLFDGEVALVTGGGTGIGAAVTEELGALGAKIAICGRREEPLVAQAQRLRSMGVTVYFATCDIRKPERIAAFVEEVKSELGSIDILVNNAGGQFPSPAQHLSANGFEAVVRNNLMGTWNMTHAVASHAFIPQKRGRILNITAQVDRGFPGMAHTGAARAGVENLTKTLAVEWSQFGVRINAVAPGVIKSSGTKQYPPQLLVDAQKGNPLKRLGTCEEVSHLICYLVSPQADFITGQVVHIDGGASIWGDMWPVPDEVPQYPPYPIPE